MARPAKPIDAIDTRLRTYDRETRKKNEEKLKSGGKPVAPKHLTRKQKQIWAFICKYLEQSDVLCAADVYLLELAATSIDRIQQINGLMNESVENMVDVNFRKALVENTTIFFRACNELGLSPQSRAKMAKAMSEAANQHFSLENYLSSDGDDEEGE